MGDLGAGEGDHRFGSVAVCTICHHDHEVTVFIWPDECVKVIDDSEA